MGNSASPAEVGSSEGLGGVEPENDHDCPTCSGEGLVRLMTSHLGPDDYEYDDQCQDCAGTGSANPKTAIVSLPYSLHRVRGCQVIERAAVLRIIEAHLARIETPNGVWNVIKRFCDCCGNEITGANECGGGTSGRLGATLSRNGVKLDIEVLTAKDGTSNDGDFCKHCVLDALQKLDDRPSAA